MIRPRLVNALDSDKQSMAVTLYNEKKHTVKRICQRMQISKPTLYKYIKDLTTCLPPL